MVASGLLAIYGSLPKGGPVGFKFSEWDRTGSSPFVGSQAVSFCQVLLAEALVSEVPQFHAALKKSNVITWD